MSGQWILSASSVKFSMNFCARTQLCPPHHSWFYYHNNVWREVKIIPLLIINCFPIPLRSNLCLYHPAPVHPKAMFFSQCETRSFTPIQSNTIIVLCTEYSIASGQNSIPAIMAAKSGYGPRWKKCLDNPTRADWLKNVWKTQQGRTG